MSNPSLLRTMLGEAFSDPEPVVKTASASPGQLDVNELLKLADGLEHVAQVFEANNLPDTYESPDRWVQDGAMGAPLTAAELGTPTLSPPGMSGMVPSGERSIDNLGGDLPVSNEMTVTAAMQRKHAQLRVSAAQQRVLARIKSAAMRRVAAEDPAMPGNLPTELSLTGEAPVSSPGTAGADIPQSIEGLLELTNDQADQVNRPEEAAILGADVVRAAEASTPDVLEHETGDVEPTAKAAAYAHLLRNSVLARIANGGR